VNHAIRPTETGKDQIDAVHKPAEVTLKSLPPSRPSEVQTRIENIPVEVVGGKGSGLAGPSANQRGSRNTTVYTQRTGSSENLRLAFKNGESLDRFQIAGQSLHDFFAGT
jgi:hypothetical protein